MNITNQKPKSAEWKDQLLSSCHKRENHTRKQSIHTCLLFWLSCNEIQQQQAKNKNAKMTITLAIRFIRLQVIQNKLKKEWAAEQKNIMNKLDHARP